MPTETVTPEAKPKAKAKPEGITTDDVKVEQKSDYTFPMHDPFVRPNGGIQVADPEVLKKDYADSLAFNEEPVEVMVLPSTEKFGAKTVECWVNGVGIEIWDRQFGWYPSGSIRRGEPVITKRKYIEVLLRSKTDDYKTNVIERRGEEPENKLVTATSYNYPLQIIRDDNPKGREWFRRLAGMQL